MIFQCGKFVLKFQKSRISEIYIKNMFAHEEKIKNEYS